MSLNIDFYGNQSVLPVTCGSCRGTAFYIGNLRFLTAWHVVSEAFSFNDDIVLTVNETSVFCRLVQLGELDVALLECEEELPEITPIELLKTDFRPDIDLEIIGYPQELGNGIDYFGVKVKNLRELSDKSRGFDVMVLRTDPFGFCSYAGFSGSPVLNKKGVAVGVVTDQLYNTLGYTSIAAIADKLAENKVSFLDNADSFDTRDIGIGTCEELAAEACEKMKSRYSKKNHVADEGLETQLEIFCGYNIDRWVKDSRKKLKDWYQQVKATNRSAVDKAASLKGFMDGGELTYDCYNDLDYLLNKRESHKSNLYFIKGKDRNELIDLAQQMEQAFDAINLAKKRYIYIHGNAGSGKTQHMCHFVERLSKKRNVYLLFGTDFDSRDPVLNICNTLHWKDEDILEKLNTEMEQRGRYATFIIDALNEGEGTTMWYELLPRVKSLFDKFDRLKLVVTVRTMEPNDLLNNQFKNGWVVLQTYGFSDLRKAIEIYFKDAHIYEKADNYLHVKEFQKPLFLKLFCQVYYSLPFDYRRDLDILLLYNLYYRSRNDFVSKGADEDPVRMITPQIMKQIGDLSLLKYSCGDVPRAEVIEIADNLSPNRFWSKSLYHSILTENLVMEYWLKDGLMTTFEYDSMGDYMRAQCLLLLNNYDDYKCLGTLLELLDKLNNPKMIQSEKNHIRNTIKTFLAVWNPKTSIWQSVEFKKETLSRILLDSLELRNLKSDRSTLPQDLVASIVLNDVNYINPEYLLANFTLYKKHLMEPVHQRLLKMDMVERDELWTVKVNRMQDDYSFPYKIIQPDVKDNEEDVYAYLRLLCWLLTASHPQIRNHITRVIYGLLVSYERLCTLLIEAFYQCNDPYVLRGVYGSVYGVLLEKRDKELTHQVAKLVFEKLYDNQVFVPAEIEVRDWTLKIIELNNLFSPEDGYWETVKPPFKRNDNLFEWPKSEDFYKDDYFGDDAGAKRLHHSLFEWDFNRYIIGTNSNNESKTFFKDGKGVSLSTITEAIAYRIKHVYGYTKKLSEYDEKVAWDSRYSRINERIGKKYQWIALGEVKAYLCDTCQVKKDWWGDNPPVDVPYPWYDREKTNYDPTLTLTGNRSYLDQMMFDEKNGADLFVVDAMEWVESRVQVPEPCIIVKDKDECEWVNVVGYQKQEQERDEEKRESFIFISPCMVKNDYAHEFEEWAKDQCFYGRWMPEDSGRDEYLWKEFPWSDSYKSLELDVELDIIAHGVIPSCKVVLPYATQLQENREGIEDDDEFEGMIYMPNADMFEYLDLHTAERGVTRDGCDNVVALCRNIEGDILDTMVMKRDLLNQYLDARGLTLFYCMLAEKRLYQGPQQFSMQRLSSCLKYVPDGEPEVIQPMKDERDFPKQESIEYGDEELLNDLSPEILEQIDKEGGKEAIMNFFKDYDEMILKRKEKEKTSESPK